MGPTILAIESSCDETSASVVKNGKVLNNIIASQPEHIKYGGVVPELASRAHQKNVVYVVQHALEQAGVGCADLDAVAFTKGPGLIGSLLVGASFAKGISVACGIPMITVNHLHAHALSNFIDDPVPSFPFLCLTVSGGHTQLVIVRDFFDLELIGETQDDAAGEAFDKTAKMLGLPYPGGPWVDKHAATGNPRAFDFPGTSVGGYDFSFSGIKTAVLYFLRDHTRVDDAFIKNNLADICASIQHRIVGMLMDKLKSASAATGIREIALAGGVSANKGLRDAVHNAAKENGWNVYMPDFQYCTDNAAMIALVAHHKFQQGIFAGLDEVPVARYEPGTMR